MQIAELINHRILILGLGKEGLSTLAFLRRRFPQLPLHIADRTPLEGFPKDIRTHFFGIKNITLHLGKNYLDHLTDFDLIIKTPGISPYISKIQLALNRGVRITSQTELFFANTVSKTIGVTGTKGKSTTVSLIYHLLKCAGFNARLGGNIGTPVLELLDKSYDWVVIELSSHQLWQVTKSPHIAVFLNIFADHLDYSDFHSYFDAKKNIARFQTPSDFFIYNGSFPTLTRFADRVKSQKYIFGIKSANLPSCTVLGNDLVFAESGNSEKICDLVNMPLLGSTGKQNIAAAALVAKILGVSNTLIDRGLKCFTPLRGRLENIGIYDSLTIFEDYLATIPEATLNALEVLEGQVKCVFLGGHERNQDYTRVLAEISRQRIPLVILFPPNGARIKSQFDSLSQSFKPQLFLVATMQDAVSKMFIHTERPGTVLFSTGAPSFGMFKDYADRSRQFHYWLNKLKKSSSLIIQSEPAPGRA